MKNYITHSIANNYGEELVFEYEENGNEVDIDIYNRNGFATFTMSKKQLEELIKYAEKVRNTVK